MSILASLLLATPILAAPPDLADRAVEIDMVPLDAPLEDLAPLARVLEGVDVVYLGETTHDDGGATTARLRVVRYLHEELGFDTLLYEAPRIPCAQANQDHLDGTPADEALPGCAWGFWSRTTQSAPLRAWLDARRDAGTPLRIAGMDPQNFSGDGPELARWLDEQLVEEGVAALSPESHGIVARVAVGADQAEAQQRWPGSPKRWLKKLRTLAPDKSTQQAVLAELADRRTRLPAGSEAGALIADIEALSAEWTGRIEDINDARDRRMADVLLDEAQEHKLIVWGATLHGAHDLDTLRPKRIRQVTLGDHAHAALGKRYYVVGVSAIEGEIGGLYSKTSRPLPERHPEALESVLRDAGTPSAFVDLRGLGGESMISEVLGHHRRGPWADVLDGVLVFPRTEPVRFEPSRKR